jgi:non-specific serine/threonine protein kinase
MANLPNESHVAGTLFYLAPELIAGQPADIPSDLYALGATLYEMITGRVPFSDYDEENILAQHLEESVRPPSQSRGDVPPALEKIVLRLLEKNPKDRFASAQEVHEALEKITLIREDRTKGNLSQRKTEISGHENELAQVKQSLESYPLVTVSDESLALASASQLGDQFSDGVWFVDLKPLTEPSLVLETVASTLGVCPDPNRSLTVSLVEYLREKNLLLLLLHCDRFPGACAQLVETILRGCPDVRILATSMKALNVPGEISINDSTNNL